MSLILELFLNFKESLIFSRASMVGGCPGREKPPQTILPTNDQRPWKTNSSCFTTCPFFFLRRNRGEATHHRYFTERLFPCRGLRTTAVPFEKMARTRVAMLQKANNSVARERSRVSQTPRRRGGRPGGRSGLFSRGLVTGNSNPLAPPQSKSEQHVVL